MMDPYIGIIVDGALGLLLVAVIVTCLIVYRRLKALQNGQDEMKKVVSDLNMAVNQAQKSVLGMKQTAVEVEAQLQTQIKKAKLLSDELIVITEAGNNLADRIEKKLTQGKSSQGNLNQGDKTSGHTSSDGIVEKVKTTDQGKKVGAKQKELLDALKEAR